MKYNFSNESFLIGITNTVYFSESLKEKLIVFNWIYFTVADPEFPRWGRQPKGSQPTYYLANLSRKLHANEEILGQRGARVPRAPSPRSANWILHCYEF